MRAGQWLAAVPLLLVCSAAVAQAVPAADAPAANVARPAKRELAPDRVAGRVISADGRAIGNAVVSLTSQADGAANTVTVRSDTDGRYRFEAQPAGRYSLQGRAAGYVTSLYQQHGQLSTGLVLGAGLATDALELRLVPDASVRGRVSDGSGEAVQRAELQLFRRAQPATAGTQSEIDGGPRATRFRNAVSDDRGDYRFDNLPPGSYYLSATATPWYAVHAPPENQGSGNQYRPAVDPALDVAYPPVFYPHALKPEEASPLEIKGGERVTANLQMVAERAVTLTVQLSPVEPGQAYRMPQLTRTVFGVVEQVPTQSMTVDNVTSITGLLPGQYGVAEFVQNSGLMPRGSIDIASGSRLDAAALDGADLATATVQVSGVEGASLPQGLQLRLRGTAAESRNPVKVSDTGMAELRSLAAGSYRIDVLRGGRLLPTVGLALNGKASADLQLHVPASNAALQVQLTVSASSAQLTGFVRRGGKPVGGSLVVLVPAVTGSPADLFRRDQSDLDGSFHLGGVVAGNYLLVAIDDGWTLPWTDAAALAPYLARAVPVTIPTGRRGVVAVAEEVQPQAR